MSTTYAHKNCLSTPYVQGTKVFLAAPPTPANLAAYESWSSSDMQARSWLGAGLHGAVQLRLEAGATLMLPPGETIGAVRV